VTERVYPASVQAVIDGEISRGNEGFTDFMGRMYDKMVEVGGDPTDVEMWKAVATGFEHVSTRGNVRRRIARA
jgi:hypothetical protein